MSKIHSIRLNGPWDARVVECNSPLDPELNRDCRVTIPSTGGTWPGRGFRGRIEYRRRFRRPTGLSDDQRVFLVIELRDGESQRCRVSCFLNGESVGELPWGELSVRVEIRARLCPSNQVFIVVDNLPEDCGEAGAGVIGGVRLEIEENC